MDKIIIQPYREEVSMFIDPKSESICLRAGFKETSIRWELIDKTIQALQTHKKGLAKSSK